MEIWAPNKEAGITDYDWIHWYREHPAEDDLKLLKWSDEQCGGQAHVDWYPFRTRSWARSSWAAGTSMNYWRNPPPHLREREAARFPAWMTQIALSLPKLELLRTEVRALGADTWRVRFAVANSGYLPAYVSKRALERKTARGVVFEIHLPPGAEPGQRQASASKARSSKAMRPRPRCRPSCPTRASPPTARWPNGWCAGRAARASA